jgi:acetyl esterase/lipase
MKFSYKTIDKELRFMGRVLHLVNRTFTTRRLRLFFRVTQLRFFKPRGKFFTFDSCYLTRSDGSRMRVCIYEPKHKQDNLPGILWLHGGGYAIGAPEYSSPLVTRLMKTRPCVVIAPDYRLSPQAPYPAALEDAYEVLLWMKKEAKNLSINPQQIIVGGESAGGGLCAALCLYARDKKEVNIAFQMPVYPMLDDRMITPSSQHNVAPGWNSKSNYNAWKMYLGDLFETDQVPAYAAPARETNYQGLPPTITYVGDLETFKDETIQFVENLKKANVPVLFRLYPGAFHAFDILSPWAKVSKEARKFVTESFACMVDQYQTEA